MDNETIQNEGRLMKCACVYIGEYEPNDFFENKKIKARKDHLCCECGRTIEKGEEYERVSLRQRGDKNFQHYETCSDCLSIREAFFCEGYIFEEQDENLLQHITDMRGEISSECLADLPPRARDHVCELIEQGWRYLEEEEGA
jgi:hypothetical protein